VFEGPPAPPKWYYLELTNELLDDATPKAGAMGKKKTAGDALLPLLSSLWSNGRNESRLHAALNEIFQLHAASPSPYIPLRSNSDSNAVENTEREIEEFVAFTEIKRESLLSACVVLQEYMTTDLPKRMQPIVQQWKRHVAMLKSCMHCGPKSDTRAKIFMKAYHKDHAQLEAEKENPNLEDVILSSLHSTLEDIRNALLDSKHRDQLFVDGWSFKDARALEETEQEERQALESKQHGEETKRALRIDNLLKQAESDGFELTLVTEANAVNPITEEGGPEYAGGLLSMPLGWRIQRKGNDIKYISPDYIKVCRSLKQVAEWLDQQSVTDLTTRKFAQNKTREPTIKFANFQNTSSLWWSIMDLKLATLAGKMARNGFMNGKKKSAGSRSLTSSSGGKKKRKR